MTLDPAGLPADAQAFLTAGDPGELTIVNQNAKPLALRTHFSWDDAAGMVRVVTAADDVLSQLVASMSSTRANLCRSDGRRWLRLEGVAVATSDYERVAEALRRQPGQTSAGAIEPEQARAIEVSIDRAWGPAFIPEGLVAAVEEA